MTHALQDSIESLLRELGIEGNDVIRKNLSRSRFRFQDRLKPPFRKDATSDSSHDCDEDITRLLQEARHRQHHTPSNRKDQPREEEDEDVYRDCHYSKGSAYGYLINRCPDYPLAITTTHSHSHGYGHGRSQATIAGTAAALRRYDLLFAPGMILFAMLLLLLLAVAIVEAVDVIWKKNKDEDDDDDGIEEKIL